MLFEPFRPPKPENRIFRRYALDGHGYIFSQGKTNSSGFGALMARSISCTLLKRICDPLVSKAATAQPVPAPPHLAPKPADTCLIVYFHQQTQSSFHDRLFVACAGAAHGLLLQLVIDFDVGPHNVFDAKNLTFTGPEKKRPPLRVTSFCNRYALLSTCRPYRRRDHHQPEQTASARGYRPPSLRSSA
jgi:hypothetical protein